MFLQAYNMEDWKYVDGKSENPILIKNLAMNIITVTHPTILEQIQMKGELEETGFLPRFQIIFDSGYDINHEIRYLFYDYNKEYTRYVENTKTIAKANYYRDADAEIFEINITDEAINELNIFYSELKQKLDVGQYKHIEPYIGKIKGLSIRLAAGFHAWNAWSSNDNILSKPIPKFSMRDAIALVRVLLDQANYIFNKEEQRLYEMLDKIINKIQKDNLTEFVASKITKNTNSLKVDDILPALDFLEAQGVIAKYQRLNNEPIYIVNPNINMWKGVL